MPYRFNRWEERDKCVAEKEWEITKFLFINLINYLVGEIWTYLKEHVIYSQCWMGKIGEGFIQYNIFL